MNNVRSATRLAGFIVGLNLFAQTPTQLKPSPLTAVGEGDTGIVLRVIDEYGGTIAKAHIVLRNESGRAIVSGNTDQDGVLRFSRLAPGWYEFLVSAKFFQDVQNSLSVGQDRVIDIEVVLKDRCQIDPDLNCDEVIPTPLFVDVIQPSLTVVIEPYPILREPPSQHPGFFKRLFSWFRHRHS